uniref:phage tail spike protein n=1 Tax=Ndongobacter massiliensis TaxID=1871025 RepID=UPI0009313A66|nr:phage tail spike protein [Ndongobacter massiliensis]
MRLTLYDKNETTFQSRGIGTLTDAVSATVHEEINGVYDLTVVYPYNGKLSSEITPERLIKANTPRGEQMFRVASIQKTMDEMTIRANHLFYDLADFFIEDTFVRNVPSETAIQQVLQKTALPNPFSATSELAGSVSSRLVRKNVVEALLGDEENSLISRAGGELDRNNYNITWRSRLGSDRGVKIKYRKNLLGLDFTEDYTTVITRLMPEGFDGIFLPEKYVDSPRIGQYQQPKYGVIYYESIASKTKSPDQDGAVDHEQAMQALREAAQKEFDAGVDLPTITCEVNFIDLSQTEEYKDYVDLQRIYIGDTLRVSHHPIGVELSQRLIAYDWDALRDRYDYLQLGSPTNAFFGAVQSATIASQSALEIAKSINQSVFDKARAAATELIKQGYGGHVRIYPDKILVMDTDDEATARRVWQYNLNGQGYSTHGVNGPYTYAWTMDGAFNTSFIAANSITANQLAPDVGQNLNIAGNVAFTGVLKREDLPDLKGEPGQPGKDGADGAPGKDGLQPNLLCVSTMEKGTLDANYGTMYPTENTGTSDYIPIEEPGEYTLTLFDEITSEESKRLGKTNRLVVLSYDKDKKMLDCLSYRDATYWNNMHGKITETYTIGAGVAYVRISTVLPQTHRYKFERGKESTGWIPHALDLVGPQGPPGPRGEPGEKGVSIASIKVQYDQRKVGTRPVSEEDQGDPPEPVTWSDEVPSWKKGYIVWRRFSITYSDGIVVRTAPESLTEEAARAALESAKAYTDSLEAAIAIRDYADKAYADGAVSKSEKAIMDTLQQLLDATRAQVLDEVQKNVQGTFRGMLDRLDDLEGLIWMSNGTIYIGRKGQYEALTLTNSEIAFFVDAIKKGRLNPDDLLVTNARAVKWEFINEKEVSLYQQTTRLVDGVPHLTWYYVGG